MIQACVGLGEDALSPLLNKQLSPARRREAICLSALTLLPSDLQGFRLFPVSWSGWAHTVLGLTITDSLKVWVRGEGESRQTGPEAFATPALCHVTRPVSASEPADEPGRGLESEP